MRMIIKCFFYVTDDAELRIEGGMCLQIYANCIQV